MACIFARAAEHAPDRKTILELLGALCPAGLCAGGGTVALRHRRGGAAPPARRAAKRS